MLWYKKNSCTSCQMQPFISWLPGAEAAGTGRSRYGFDFLSSRYIIRKMTSILLFFSAAENAKAVEKTSSSAIIPAR